MIQQQKQEVKITETITPKSSESEEGSEIVPEETETPSESSTDKTTGDETLEPETKEEEPELKEEVPSGQPSQEPVIKEVQGETPREHALRLEVTRLKLERRQMRKSDLFKEESPKEISKKELSEESKKILEKYQPEELSNLKEVFEVMADDLGFVRKGEQEHQSFQTQSSDILDDFLENHTEYHPENDKGDVVWNAFKSEFELYKQPTTPRGYKKLFEKIHSSLFGDEVSPESELKKIEAQKQKTKVVSHQASSPNVQKVVDTKVVTSSIDPSLKRHMKGFEEKELKDIFGE